MPGLRTNPAVDRDASTAGQRFRRRALAAGAVAILLFLVVSGPHLGAFTPDLALHYDDAAGRDGGPMTVTLVLTNDGSLPARLDRVLVDTDALAYPDVVVTDDGQKVKLPEMVSGGESLAVHLTFDEFDCAAALTEAANVEVRAKPLLPLQAKKDLTVHGLDGNPEAWLANATRAACGA